MRKLTQEEFINKCINAHGNKYDYTKTVFTNSRDKVVITCPIHGDFMQKANEHVRGHGCPYCGGTKKLNTELFIQRAKEIHGDKYDYSETQYINSNTKIKIICKKHGIFEQLPFSHLNNSGCPKCSGRCGNTEDYISKAKEVHGNKYDYSKVEYKNNNDLITIICPIHGDFEQRAVKHLIGHGCPKCANEKRKEKLTLSKEDFIKRAKEIHGDKYDYSKAEYISMRDKVCIICPIHGEFWQYPFDHINKHACPTCGLLTSKAEEEIFELLSQYIGRDKIIRNDRTILCGRELDLYIPSKGIGIEYNGLKWHSEEFSKNWTYHIDKTNECLKKQIKLIQIFEDEYIKTPEIVKSKLLHIMNVNNSIKVMGRKCYIKEIDKEISREFLTKFHIQGYGKCTKTYGCYFGEELIGVMSFLLEGDKTTWNLVRFATDYRYTCSGVGGKLFKHFIKENNPSIIKTFADRRWTVNSDNNLYTKLGFKLDKILKPDYRYVDTQNPNERIHKFNLRKRTIHQKYNLPMSMRESEMVKKIGYSKIWDCGLYRYIWKNETV